MFPVIAEPTITLTPNAVAKVKEIMEGQGQPDSGLRIYVTGGGCSGFKYGMALDAEPNPDDEVVIVDGLKVFLAQLDLPMLKGASVDYIDDALLGQGFKVDNPQAVSSCGCGSSFRTE